MNNWDERRLFVFMHELNRAMKAVEVGVQTGKIQDTPKLREAWAEAHKQIQLGVLQTERFGVTNPLLSGGIPSNNYWKWYQEWLHWFNGLSEKQQDGYKEGIFDGVVENSLAM